MVYETIIKELKLFKRGKVREARRGIAGRAARKKVDTKTAGRASRIKAYKKLTRKK